MPHSSASADAIELLCRGILEYSMGIFPWSDLYSADQGAGKAEATIQGGCCADSEGRKDEDFNSTGQWSNEEGYGLLR